MEKLTEILMWSKIGFAKLNYSKLTKLLALVTNCHLDNATGSLNKLRLRRLMKQIKFNYKFVDCNVVLSLNYSHVLHVIIFHLNKALGELKIRSFSQLITIAADCKLDY